MKSKEICYLCKRIINTSLDNFCILKDYKKGKFYKERYYHALCFRDRILTIREKAKKEDVAMNFLKRANIALDKMGIERGV